VLVGTRRMMAGFSALAAVTLVAAGCGSTKSTSTPNSPVPTGSKDPAIFAMLPQSIQQSGVVEVGSDAAYPPVEYQDNGQIIGLDPDIAAAMGQKMGVTWHFTNATFAGLIPAVQSGRYNVAMSAMSDNKEREQKLNFLDYFNVGTSIIVAAGNPQNIQGLDDLCGKTIAVQRGTTQDEVSKEQQAKCASSGKGTLTVLTFTTDPEALLQVQTERAVADMNDYPVAEYTVQQTKGKYEVVGTQIQAGPYGIGFDKDETQLLNASQAALKAIISDGTYAAILAKWGLQQGSLTTAEINGGGKS